MKAPKEIKNWINQRRSSQGKKNGVNSWLWDAPDVEIMMAKNKRKYIRIKKVKPYETQRLFKVDE
jgi:hypothetical protein